MSITVVPDLGILQRAIRADWQGRGIMVFTAKQLGAFPDYSDAGLGVSFLIEGAPPEAWLGNDGLSTMSPTPLSDPPLYGHNEPKFPENWDDSYDYPNVLYGSGTLNSRNLITGRFPSEEEFKLVRSWYTNHCVLDYFELMVDGVPTEPPTYSGSCTFGQVNLIINRGRASKYVSTVNEHEEDKRYLNVDFLACKTEIPGKPQGPKQVALTFSIYDANPADVTTLFGYDNSDGTLTYNGDGYGSDGKAYSLVQRISKTIAVSSNEPGTLGARARVDVAANSVDWYTGG
jgi:hypothetical protein